MNFKEIEKINKRIGQKTPWSLDIVRANGSVRVEGDFETREEALDFFKRVYGADDKATIVYDRYNLINKEEK
jgi:hypothetical protein